MTDTLKFTINRMLDFDCIMLKVSYGEHELPPIPVTTEWLKENGTKIGKKFRKVAKDIEDEREQLRRVAQYHFCENKEVGDES